jgi:hypothetical protein
MPPGVARRTDDHSLLVDDVGVNRITGIAVGGFGAGALITAPVATKFDDRFQASANSLVSLEGVTWLTPSRSIGIFCASVLV